MGSSKNYRERLENKEVGHFDRAFGFLSVRRIGDDSGRSVRA
jgi:hypothetical protein